MLADTPHVHAARKGTSQIEPRWCRGGLRNDSVPPAQPGMDMLMDMVAS